MEQVERFGGAGGMMSRKRKANIQNQRSAKKQCAGLFLSKNPFLAFQAHNHLELPFLWFFEGIKIFIFPEIFARGGAIGDWGRFFALDTFLACLDI